MPAYNYKNKNKEKTGHNQSHKANLSRSLVQTACRISVPPTPLCHYKPLNISRPSGMYGVQLWTECSGFSNNLCTVSQLNCRPTLLKNFSGFLCPESLLWIIRSKYEYSIDGLITV